MIGLNEMQEIINWGNVIADPYDDLFFRYTFNYDWNVLRLEFENRLVSSKRYCLNLKKDELNIYDFYSRRDGWKEEIYECCGILPRRDFFYIPSRRYKIDWNYGKTPKYLEWKRIYRNKQLAWGIKKETKETKEIKEMLNDMYGLNNVFTIKRVIFSGRVTTVIWQDGSKTQVRCQDGEMFDEEKGLAMAIAKKALGTNKSQSNFNNIFKKWCGGEES